MVKSKNKNSKAKIDLTKLTAEKLSKLSIKKKQKEEEEIELDLEKIAFSEKDSGDSSFEEFEFSQPMKQLTDSREQDLEHVASGFAGPVFVRRGPISGVGESETGFSYTSVAGNKEEPKYISEPGATAPEYFDSSQAGRGFQQEELNREVRMMQDRRIEGSSPEKTWRVDRFEAEKAGRQNQFEAQKAQYEKYKPKVPK